MHDKTLAYIAAFKEVDHPPDKVEWHPATASIHFGEFEVDIHPTRVLLFRNGNLMGDVSGRPVKELVQLMTLT